MKKATRRIMAPPTRVDLRDSGTDGRMEE